MRILLRCLLFSFILLISCSQNTTFDRQAMLENITKEVVLPAHENFVATLAELEEASRIFNNNPNLATLSDVQAAWLAASLGRMAILPFRLGPIDDSLLHNRLDNRPPRLTFIEETFIGGSEPLTGDYLDSVGSSSVGLGAMEYLLFDPAGANPAVLATFTTAPQAGRRRELLLALAKNVHQKGQQLNQIWADYAQPFIEAEMDDGELQGSMNMLVNQMIGDVEEIIATRLGKPSGQRSNGAIRPDLVEAAYSQASLPRIIATLEGIQVAFNGGDGLGFDDYLNYLEATYESKPLSSAINTQFEQSLTALRAIDGPLEQAVVQDLPQVMEAMTEIETLLLLLKVDMTNQLGVTLTFNDNDGD